MDRLLFSLCVLVPLPALAQDFGNFNRLSYVGDGTTLSASTLLEAAERSSQQARFAATADARGRATHQVPIPLPAGLLAPSVSLTYSSDGGEHNWTGARGWMLSHGLPEITRITRKQAAQAYADVDSPHRVSGGGWDGYLWQSNGVWKYSSAGSIESNIETFTVGTTPKFRISRGGVTTVLTPRSSGDWTSWGAEGPMPVRWMPERVTDVHGNVVDLMWDDNQLLAIRYGGHCSEGADCSGEPSTPHNVEVRFGYGQRVARSYDFVDGFADVRDQRLERIDVATSSGSSFDVWNSFVLEGSDTEDGFLLKSVRALGYEQRSDSGLEPIERTLVSLTYTEYDDNLEVPFSDRAAPRHLDYRSTIPKDVDEDTIIGIALSETKQTIPIVDRSGDGLPDFIYTYSQDSWGFFEPRYAHWMTRDPGLGDSPEAFEYENDLWNSSRVDLANAIRHPRTVSGLCANPAGETYGETARYGVEINVDVDGDGLMDAVRSTAQVFDVTEFGSNVCYENVFPSANDFGWQVTYRAGRTDEFSAYYYQLPVRFPSVGAPQRSLVNDGELVDSLPVARTARDSQVEMFDMNGDGWLDVVVADEGELKVWLKEPTYSSGWKIGEPEIWTPPGLSIPALSQRLMIFDPEDVGDFVEGKVEKTLTYAGLRDMNGDGLVDYVKTCDITEGDHEDYSTFCDGYAHAPPGTPLPTGGSRMLEQWRVWFNTGTGFEDTAVLWSTPGGLAPPGIFDVESPSYLSDIDEGDNQVFACSFSFNGGPNLPPLPGLDPFDPDLVAGIPGWDDPGPELIFGEQDPIDGDGDDLPDIFDPDPDHPGEDFGSSGGWVAGDVIWGPVDIVDEPPQFNDDFPEVPVFERPDLGIGSGSCSGDPDYRRGQRVLSNLMDWDSDGRPDVVDAAAGLWYRNTGSGFDDARPLPDWMPGGLQEHYGVQMLVQNQDPNPNDAIPDAWGTAAHNQEVWRVQDWNNDGVPDLVVPYSDFDSPLEPAGFFEKGVTYGQYPPPGLLRTVTTETGAVTTLDYSPGSTMHPSGIVTRQHVGVPQIYHHTPSPQDLVTSITVEDPITQQGAVRTIEYRDGICELGQCLGFETRIVNDAKSDRTIGGPLDAIEWSETHIDYLLTRDHQVVMRQELLTDHARAHVPGSVGPADFQTTWMVESFFEQDPFSVPTDTIPDLWTQRRRVLEYAQDGPGEREWEITVVRDPATGLPTQMRHEPITPAAPEDGIVVVTEWIGDDAGGRSSFYVPSRQYTEAWSHELQDRVVVEEGRFAYDGQDVDATSHQRGLLTLEEVCGAEPGNAICQGGKRLRWTHEYTDRGARNHTLGTEKDEVFFAHTILGFGFGETVPTVEENALGHQISRVLDELGRIGVETDSNGVTTYTYRDTFGRVVETQRQAPFDVAYTTSERAYDTSTVPNTLTETLYNRDFLNNEIPRVRHEVFDGFGDLQQSWDPNAAGDGFIVNTSLRDAFGNELHAQYPRTAYGSFTPTGSYADFGTYVAEAYYDGTGRVVWAETDASDAMTTTVPAPGVTRTRDADGYVKEVVSDTHGRVVEVREGKGGLVTTGRYEYDGRGRVTRFTDANGDAHRYRYDGAGRLLDVFRAANGQLESPYWSYAYEGPYVTRAYEEGVREVVRWEYDALGRTTAKEIYADFTGESPGQGRGPGSGRGRGQGNGQAPVGGDWQLYTWTWDHLDGRVWNGVRHAVSDPAGETRYYYDEMAPWGTLGRLTSIERENDASLQGLMRAEYEHDFEGRTTTTSFPSTPAVAIAPFTNTEYSPTGWKIQDSVILNPGKKTLALDYGYGEWGELTDWQGRADGVQWTFAADFDLEIERASPNRQTATTLTIDDGSTVQDTRIEYGYQANGWLSEKSVRPPLEPLEVLRYSYDALGRASTMRFASGAEDEVLERYVYDDAGHLMDFERGFGPQREGWTYTRAPFGETPSRTDRISTTIDSHQYDAIGRMETWDTDGPAGLVTRDFSYDGSSRLRRIEKNGMITDLYYDVDDQLVYEERGADVYERFAGLRRGPDGTIHSPLPAVRILNAADVANQEARIALLDLDGQALFTWDLFGEEKSREITGMYGVPLVGPTWDEGEVWEIDGLHGAEEDRENEVVHFGVRHTLYRDGMWMQPEPLLAAYLSGSVATSRSYALGNPLGLSDVSGWAPFTFTNAKNLEEELETTPELTDALLSAGAEGLEADRDIPGAEALVIGGSTTEDSPAMLPVGSALPMGPHGEIPDHPRTPSASGKRQLSMAQKQMLYAAAVEQLGAIIPWIRVHSHGIGQTRLMTRQDLSRNGMAAVAAGEITPSVAAALTITEVGRSDSQMQVISGGLQGLYLAEGLEAGTPTTYRRTQIGLSPAGQAATSASIAVWAALEWALP